MVNKLDVLLINPHLEFPDDTSGRSKNLRRKEYLLNGGLLSVGTHLKRKGIGVEILDLTQETFPFPALESLMSKQKPKIIGISNQSCYSYLSTLACARLTKAIDPYVQVVVGGLHASGIPELLLAECEDVDVVVVGEGEIPMANLARGNSPNKRIVRRQQIIDPDDVAFDYQLYPRFQEYVPYIEESRGCKHGCTYCISPLVNRRKIRIRRSLDIAEDIHSLQKLYGTEFHFYLEANNFAVDHAKTTELASILSGTSASWRTESRVDTFPIHLIGPLVDAGLRVLDIGLESASPEMLTRMHKTKSPAEYLRTGIRIAEEIAKNGKCLLKLNLMLFYGETRTTIAETRAYLKTISNICPLSIAAGPVRMDPGSAMYQVFTKKVNLAVFDGTFWGKVHCYPVDLSGELSFEVANRICLELCQKFQTSEAFFRAQRYSQLPYLMTYEKFMIETSESIPHGERPWSD